MEMDRPDRTVDTLSQQFTSNALFAPQSDRAPGRQTWFENEIHPCRSGRSCAEWQGLCDSGTRVISQVEGADGRCGRFEREGSSERISRQKSSQAGPAPPSCCTGRHSAADCPRQSLSPSQGTVPVGDSLVLVARRAPPAGSASRRPPALARAAAGRLA